MVDTALPRQSGFLSARLPSSAKKQATTKHTITCSGKDCGMSTCSCTVACSENLLRRSKTAAVSKAKVATRNGVA
eukprot:COSAG02_NODE_12_length_58022_cov_242.077379_11_plen_75_part_00